MDNKTDHYVSTGLVLKPGDKVLLTTTTDFDLATVENMAAGLRERFPDVEFSFIAGITGMAVQHG